MLLLLLLLLCSVCLFLCVRCNAVLLCVAVQLSGLDNVAVAAGAAAFPAAVNAGAAVSARPDEEPCKAGGLASAAAVVVSDAVRVSSSSSTSLLSSSTSLQGVPLRQPGSTQTLPASPSLLPSAGPSPTPPTPGQLEAFKRGGGKSCVLADEIDDVDHDERASAICTVSLSVRVRVRVRVTAGAVKTRIRTECGDHAMTADLRRHQPKHAVQVRKGRAAHH
ncbi:MAG TPA: hypothetical protein V6C97_35430, partial [Oculatellaceae cyanobacterium]